MRGSTGFLRNLACILRYFYLLFFFSKKKMEACEVALIQWHPGPGDSFSLTEVWENIKKRKLLKRMFGSLRLWDCEFFRFLGAFYRPLSPGYQGRWSRKYFFSIFSPPWPWAGRITCLFSLNGVWNRKLKEGKGVVMPTRWTRIGGLDSFSEKEKGQKSEKIVAQRPLSAFFFSPFQSCYLLTTESRFSRIPAKWPWMHLGPCPSSPLIASPR